MLACQQNKEIKLTSNIENRLEEVGAAASKEYSLEKALQKMKSDWKDMTFNFIQYRDSVRISSKYLCPHSK